MEAFSSFKLEEPRLSNASNSQKDSKMEAMDVDDLATATLYAVKSEFEEAIASNTAGTSNTDHFFAKFLTNPKLLALQLSDSNFRRSVLVQFLILFQYLQITVKFKT